MRFILLFILSLLSLLSYAQAPGINYSKVYGGTFPDYGRSIQPAPDGGFIVAGSSESSSGDVSANRGGEDYWLFKINSAGQIQWQQTYGGVNSDRCYDMKLTSDGGYIMAGEAWWNSGQITGNHGSADFWIVKVDSLRNIVWQRSFGGNNEDVANAIEKTNDGGYIITGYTNSTNGDVIGFHGPNYKDVWVVKIDSLGVKQWAKVFGGTNDDQGKGVVQTVDGGYLVVAKTASTDGDVVGNHGLFDGWLIKLDANGNLQWQRPYGGTEDDQFFSVMRSLDNNYVITGAVTSRDGDMPAGPNNDYDYWVMKVDPTGNIIWNKKPGSGFAGDYALKARQTSDSSFLITGYHFVTTFATQGLVYKLSPAGDVQWQKSMGSNSQEYLLDIQPASDGSFVTVGFTNGSNNGDIPVNHSPGSFEVWIVKSHSFTKPPAPVMKSLPATICSGTNITGKLLNPPPLTTITISNGFGNLSYNPADSLFSIPVPNGGTHLLKIIYSNSYGADSSIFSFVAFQSPIISLNHPDTSICSGSSINLTASGATTYLWSPATGLNTSSGNSVIATPVTNTTYIVTGSANGCSSSDTITIAVLPVVTPSVSISYTGCPSNTLSFTAAVTNGGSNPVIGWYVNNMLTGGGANFTLNNAQNGVQVYARLASSLPCAQNPVNSATTTLNCVTTALNSLTTAEGFLSGPNPTNGKFSLKMQFASTQKLSWELHDQFGRMLLSEPEKNVSGNHSLALNLNGYAKGVYYLKLKTGKEWKMMKIIVK